LGHRLLWAVFLKISEIAPIEGLPFSTITFTHYFKNGLGYILGDFLQTHLVTLGSML
jgi:hypothetical protein